jgi:hypothetical protein
MKFLFLINLIYPIISKIPFNESAEIQNLTLSADSSKLLIQEKIFNDFPIFPFIIILFGCFIVLYGAYYNFFFIIKTTLFLYYIFSIFIKYDDDVINRNLLFILLFAFISAILLYIVFKSYIKFIESHIYIKKAVLGAMTGCFLTLTIFHFIHEFDKEYDQNLYFIFFPIMIVVIGVLNVFFPIKIAFVPCSVISGLFFIQLSVDCLFGTDFSDTEKILDVVFFVVFLILSFLFQIYYLKRKEKEKPGAIHTIKTTVKKNLDITLDNNQTMNEYREMGDKNRESIKSNDEVDETQDNQIDDQDD